MMSCAYSCERLIWPLPFTADRQAGFPGRGGWTLCLPMFGANLCFWQKHRGRAQPPPAPLFQLFTLGKPQRDGFPRVRWGDGEGAPSPAPAAGAPLKCHFLEETCMGTSTHLYTRLMQTNIQLQDGEKCLNTTLYVPLSPTFICFSTIRGPQHKNQEPVTRLKKPISKSLPIPLTLHLCLNNLFINFPG